MQSLRASDPALEDYLELLEYNEWGEPSPLPQDIVRMDAAAAVAAAAGAAGTGATLAGRGTSAACDNWDELEQSSRYLDEMEVRLEGIDLTDLLDDNSSLHSHDGAESTTQDSASKRGSSLHGSSGFWDLQPNPAMVVSNPQHHSGPIPRLATHHGHSNSVDFSFLTRSSSSRCNDGGNNNPLQRTSSTSVMTDDATDIPQTPTRRMQELSKKLPGMLRSVMSGKQRRRNDSGLPAGPASVTVHPAREGPGGGLKVQVERGVRVEVGRRGERASGPGNMGERRAGGQSLQ